MLQGFLGQLEPPPPKKVKNIQLHASLKLFAGTISNLGAVTQWCLCCMHICQNIKKFP